MLRDRLNIAFASLLLVGVAVTQIVRVSTHRQSAWKGGGFGMFSTSDSPDSRFVRCILVGGDGEHRIPVPSGLSDLVELARVVPTRENLREVARAARAMDWVREDWTPLQAAPASKPAGPAPSAESPDAGQSGRADLSLLSYRPVGKDEPRPPAEYLLEVRQVRVEVWRMRLDPSRMIMRAESIRAESVEE